eukprot:6208349-Pleurochrysis_carterae.AAC.2
MCQPEQALRSTSIPSSWPQRREVGRGPVIGGKAERVVARALRPLHRPRHCGQRPLRRLPGRHTRESGRCRHHRAMLASGDVRRATGAIYRY